MEHHSSDILSIPFKHTRILRFFGLYKKYLIQRPIFKPLYFYNVFFLILENTSFLAPSKNTCISYVTTMWNTCGNVWNISNGATNMIIHLKLLPIKAMANMANTMAIKSHMFNLNLICS